MGTPPWRVGIAGDLHPALDVAMPWAVERGAEGLRVYTSAWDPVLRLPLERDGRLRVEIALTLEDLDWSGSVDLLLQDRPTGEVLAGLHLNGRGGARLTHARISCAPAAAAWAHGPASQTSSQIVSATGMPWMSTTQASLPASK